MEKVLIADFSSDKDRVTVRGLWQFDRGVKLKVIGINVADVNRVDFAPVIASEAVPVVVVPDEDGTFTVSIPGAATKSPYDVTAYIYVDTAEYGYTVKAVSMPVILRPEAGKPGEEEKPDPFGEVVEKVSGYAKEARDSARAAAESEKAASESATQAEKAKEASRESAEKAAESKEAAATSATAATESASQARESDTAARSAADEATESATAAAESETAAAKLSQSAERSATNASGSAESASRSAETAKTAADAASKSGSAAQQAVRSAAESASTASTAAQTATTAAGKASESATTANQSAENAGQKATAAETAASSAAESATEAGKSATAAGDSAGTAKASETAAEEAAQTAQEQAGKIKDSAEQIEKNKSGVAALEEGKADKTTLAVTERKLDALWKLNQGVSYQFEEDSTEAYHKTVPSGAKLASVKRIGGKTIVWNQLIENPENEKTLACNDVDNYVVYGWYDLKGYKAIIGHTYLVSFECYMERTDTYFGVGVGNYFGCGKLNNNSNTWSKIKKIVTTRSLDYSNIFYIFYNAAPRVMEIGEEVKTRNVNVFDLTKMFGSGNEPSTMEEFEAMFPDDYYSYNPGELLSACVSEVVEQGKNLLDVSNITDVDVDGKGSIRQGVIIPVVKGTYKTSALKAENNIFVKRVVGNNYATPADLSSKEVSLTFDTNGSIYIYATDGKIEGVQVEKGSVVTQYSPYHKNTYPVLEAVRQLPGYGWSVGGARNEVAYENKQYIQRVGRTEFNGDEQWYSWGYTVDGAQGLLVYVDSAKVPTNNNNNNNILTSKYTVMEYTKVYIGDEGVGLGVYENRPALLIRDSNYTNVTDWKHHLKEENLTAYYELAEPIVTDISDLIGDTFQEPFEVEAGGMLTFRNSHGDGFQIPVPNTEEYIVSLTEVGGVTE